MDEHAQARVGSVINKKYRLGRLIGSGGMASVYEAVHRNANRVAIKMLHPHLSIDADLRARFLREGYVANTVDHRGAVRVLDDDIADDGSVFLVMELLEGETLDARWQRGGGRLPDRDVCELAYQLLDVLAAAHAKGIVHRDIKPENLFLTSEGVLKVLDFGIARLRETSGLEGATRTGRMMGTPAFMPPEQVLGRSRQIDGQTDLYAVGATMFTLVSGHFVHEGETVEEMLIHAGSRPARSVTTVAPQLPAVIAGVIDRALAFQKEERWPSARAMEGALADVYRAAFGVLVPGARKSQRPSTGPIAPTVGDPPASIPPRRPPVAPTAPAETAGSGTQMATSWAPPPPLAKGISTTAGVASVHFPAAQRPDGVPGRRPRRVALWGGLGGVVLAALGGGALFMTHDGGDAGVGGAPAPASTSATPMSIAAPPLAISTVTLPAMTAAAEPAMRPDASVVQEPIGPARMHARPSPPVAPASKPPVATPEPTPVMPAAGPQPAPQPTNNCDPPYFIDSAGHRQYKHQCL